MDNRYNPLQQSFLNFHLAVEERLRTFGLDAEAMTRGWKHQVEKVNFKVLEGIDRRMWLYKQASESKASESGVVCKELSRREFQYPVSGQTLNVLELVLEYGHPLLRKILWVRDNLETLYFEGYGNPFLHKNYCVTSVTEFTDYPVHLESSRKSVERAFTSYWTDILKCIEEDKEQEGIKESYGVEGEDSWRTKPSML